MMTTVIVRTFSKDCDLLKSIKTDRAIAIQTLGDVLDTGAYANIALRKNFAESDIDQRARAFVTDLVNETLRNLIYIDHLISKFSNTPITKMKPFILNLLRVSVCQIKFMSKIPDRASVNEAVVLTKQFGFVNLAPFVNGMLRNIARDKSEATGLALQYSYPSWLLKKINTWLGSNKAVEDFLCNSHQPPPVIALANIHKTCVQALKESLASDGVTATELDNSKHPFIVLHKPGDITRLSAYKNGLFFIMDPGTMHAIDAIAPQPHLTIIDMCAAPGGKSFAMAGLMKNSGTIHAHDIHKHRVELIAQTMRRLELTNIITKVHDATDYDQKYENTADAVLLDAPCTGFGTIRKHPEIKYRRSAQDVTDMANLQKNMLNTAARYVKPGGKLVYCTCTISTDENGDNVRHFLSQNINFQLKNERQILPCATSDAFYVATLIKRTCARVSCVPALLSL